MLALPQRDAGGVRDGDSVPMGEALSENDADGLDESAGERLDEREARVEGVPDPENDGDALLDTLLLPLALKAREKVLDAVRCALKVAQPLSVGAADAEADAQPLSVALPLTDAVEDLDVRAEPEALSVGVEL